MYSQRVATDNGRGQPKASGDGRLLEPLFASISCVVLGAGRYTFPPGWRLPANAAPHCRLFVSVHGAADVLVDGERHRLEPGGVILVPPHATHEAWHDPVGVSAPGASLTSFVIDFEARLHGVLDVAAVCGIPISIMPGPVRRPKIAESAYAIVRHLTHLIPGYQLAVHTHCVRLLDLLWKETIAQTPSAAPVGGIRAVELLRLRPVFRLIETCYAERLTLSDLASVIHLHPAYFSTLFKHVTGVSPHHYLAHYRLERARDHLLASDRSLKEIASMTGFYDAAHLIRVFRRFEGVSPGRYRRFGLAQATLLQEVAPQ